MRHIRAVQMMTVTPAPDYRAQHLREGEIYDAPADDAGERKRVVPTPLDTYLARGWIDGHQHAAGKLLYEDYALGVHGASNRNPTMMVRHTSQAPGLPPKQIIAGMRVLDALALFRPSVRRTVEAVCCRDVSVSELVGRSRRPRGRAFRELGAGLRQLVLHYRGEGRL